jgi:hypothetical protein
LHPTYDLFTTKSLPFFRYFDIIDEKPGRQATRFHKLIIALRCRPLDPSAANDYQQDEQYQNHACRSEQTSYTTCAASTADESHVQSSLKPAIFDVFAASGRHFITTEV